MPKQQEFKINEDVRALHQQGLDLSKTDFIGAQAAYAGAMEMIRLGRADLDELSARMHMARLLRDDGFLHVRKALAEDTENIGTELYQGLGQLFTSMTLTQLMKDRQVSRYSPDAWRDLRAEHGATHGAIGRLGTVALVLSEDINFDPLAHYIEAHDNLHKGSNRYYETSNAMHAARHLVVIGQPSRASVWRARAWRSVETARRLDKDNYRASKADFNKRKKFLSDQKTAIKSVKTAP